MHFTEQELAGRREKVVAELQRRGLAALLIFRQESMYYLTGCYTSTAMIPYGPSGTGSDPRVN